MFEQPESMKKDHDNVSTSWTEKYFKDIPPIFANYLENREELDKKPFRSDLPYRDILV